MRKSRAGVLLISAIWSASCATLDDFNRTGTVWSDSAVCSAYFDAARRKDVSLWRATGAEMAKRKLTEQQCLVFADNQRQVVGALAAVGAAVVVTALVVGAAKSAPHAGSSAAAPLIVDYQWDWDLQRHYSGGAVWVCRGVQSGQYANQVRCVGVAQTDIRWPGLDAYTGP